MWLRVLLVVGTIVVLGAVGVLTWRGTGIAPEEMQAAQDRITATEQEISQLQSEINNLQTEIQANQQRINELESQVVSVR